MQSNWPTIIGIIIIAVGLLVLIVRQHRKDEEELTEQLNDNHSRDHVNDSGTDRESL